MAYLQLDRLTKQYGTLVALDEVSFEVGSNEYVTLLGPSGSGKTTLLRTIAGFERPDAGDVRLEGSTLTRLPAHRRAIGVVFQAFGLFPHLSVFDNVAYGLRHREVDPVRDEAEVKRRVNRMLDLVGLEGLGTRGVDQISGGQRQRVALARTLVTEPKITLLDEPLGALDANLRERMQFELRSIRQELGVTFLHVTGNEHEALIMGDRVAVLDQGRILQVDTPSRLYEAPTSATVARFLSAYTLFQGRLEGDHFHCQDGNFPVAAGLRSGTAGYAIRYDATRILGLDETPDEGQVALSATFVTDEYSGSLMTYFFRTTAGTLIEVEEHVSHQKPRSLTRGAAYTLSWSQADALVYPGGAP